MKLKTTKRLFFKKYLYKVDIYDDYDFIFSSWNNSTPNDYQYAKSVLKNLNSQHNQNKTLTIERKSYFRSSYTLITRKQFRAIKKLLNLMENTKESFRTRTGYNKLTIYTNDYNMIEAIVSSKDINCIEFWEPDSAFVDTLLTEEDVIISNSPVDYEYKVTINTNAGMPELTEWLQNNKDKIKITDYALRKISHGYTAYFYVKDQKFLLLLQLFLGKEKSKVEKIVYIKESVKDKT